MDQRGTVSRLLDHARRGYGEAKEQLARLLHGEVYCLAEGALRGERAGHTLQPADMVQEVFLRLLEGDVLQRAENRAYLYGAAATAIRRILVDYARRRGAARHGGDWQRVPLLEDALDRYAARHIDVLALHEALEELRTLHARQCQIVDEYHFGGFTLREIAGHLGVSEATVSIDLRRAQLWLSTRLAGET
jgi:RNA polymerase sigma factor (TIGR02999 family)